MIPTIDIIPKLRAIVLSWVSVIIVEIVRECLPSPQMTPIEQYLYNYLIRSARFNRFVTGVFNRVNGIKVETVAVNYKPNLVHKVNAFFILWRHELKSLFKR